jgi:MoaA/NifB/PqqE/SkfB family radical SAM enzyme
MGPTGDKLRVFQVHPTQRCNLQCLHCYSSSSPAEHATLPIDLLCSALDDASAEGYTVAGVSGGEPLLYPQLRSLLLHAQSRGMITTVTSNGMLLDDRRLATLDGALDLLAISLDGVPASHARMRNNERAFDSMQKNLDGVRRSGLRFGFIFTLTQFNLHELEWVARFAVDQGAKLLQVHPLEYVGRARSLLDHARPDSVETSFAVLETQRLRQEFADRITIQLDLASRAGLVGEPGRIFAARNASPGANERPLADIVSPLVVETDGTVVPLRYGFARVYALGSLYDARLSELNRKWRSYQYDAFRHMCQEVFDQLVVPSTAPVLNWYDAVGEFAQAGARAGVEPISRFR